MRDAFAERMLTATAANGNVREVDVYAFRIKFDTRTSCGREKSTPVGVRSGECRFNEWRICDRASDAVCVTIRRSATNFDFYQSLGAFAICSDLQRKRSANLFQRFTKPFVRHTFFRDFLCTGLSVGKNRHRIIRGSVAVDSDRVEGSDYNSA